VSRVEPAQLAYPFRTEPQGDPQVAFMREFMDGFLRRHRLFHDPDLYVGTVVHFARFCTPPGTSEDGLAAACMYMTWVLYLDDASAGSVGGISDDVVARYVDTVENDSVVPRTPGEGALHELVSRVRSIAERSGASTAEFATRLVEMMRAQAWERAGIVPSRAHYERYRPAAIGNGAFVSIMKLDGGVSTDRLDPLTKARALLLEELATRLVYLSNDILSQHREEHDPTALSLVRVLASERGLSWSDALVEATRVHAQDVDSYSHVRAELLSHPDPDCKRLVGILDCDVDGNLAAMAFIRSRYRAGAE
jgi:hypothetical protein